MPAWPAGLPQFVLRNGYEEGFKDLALRSQMDSGATKRRKRFTDGPEPNMFPIELTDAELDIFKTFLYDTIAGGALSFTKEHPRTLVTETFAFKSNPKPVRSVGHDSCILMMDLEQLP